MDRIQFRNVLEAFAKIDPAMPLSALQALVWVANNDGAHQNDLEQYLGTSNATASRAIQWWSDWRSFKDKKRGPGYVESYPDPMDKRYRIVKLTPAGKVFMDETFGGKNGEAARNEMAS